MSEYIVIQTGLCQDAFRAHHAAAGVRSSHCQKHVLCGGYVPIRNDGNFTAKLFGECMSNRRDRSKISGSAAPQFGAAAGAAVDADCLCTVLYETSIYVSVTWRKDAVTSQTRKVLWKIKG